MRLVSVAAFLLALAIAGTALAAPAATKDPSQLILARTDFPAGAKWTWANMPANYIQALAASSIKAKAAYYHVQIGSALRGQTVDGLVNTTGSAAQAAKLFRLSTAEGEEFGKNGTPIRLPSFGSKQSAFYTARVPKIELLVLKNRMVWLVETAVGGSKAKLVAEIKKYAAKQQARIGAG